MECCFLALDDLQVGDHHFWHQVAYKSMQGADGLHGLENFVLVSFTINVIE